MRPTMGLLLTAALIAWAHGAYCRGRHIGVRADRDLATANLNYKSLMSAAFAKPPAASWSDAGAGDPGPSIALSHDAARPPVLPTTSISPRPDAPSRQASVSRPLPAFSLPDEGFSLAGRGAATWSASGGRYAVDFAPQAGLDWSDARASAQAGGMVRLGLNGQDQARRPARGFTAGRAPGAADRGRGRWFLFAAASGQVVGFNVGQGGPGAPSRGLWATPGGDTLISDAQAGLGWRKGAMLASFGYVHREVHYDSGADTLGPQNVRDSMVGISFSLRP